MKVEKGDKIERNDELSGKYLMEGLKLLDKFAERFKLSNEGYQRLKLAMEKEMREKKFKLEDIPSFVAMFLKKEFIGDKRIKEIHKYIVKRFKPDLDKVAFYQLTPKQWVASWESIVNSFLKRGLFRT